MAGREREPIAASGVVKALAVARSNKWQCSTSPRSPPYPPEADPPLADKGGEETKWQSAQNSEGSRPARPQKGTTGGPA